MIGFVLDDRCDGCGRCVAVCPMNVLESDAGRISIARQEDCQTCFLCELYCASDAIYVDPLFDRIASPDPQQIRDSGLLGRFRRLSGWQEWDGDPRYPNEHWRMGQIFAEAPAVMSRDGHDTPLPAEPLPAKSAAAVP